jgi:hypothetical protein
VREVRVDVNLSSSTKTIETNGVMERTGKDCEMREKSIGSVRMLKALKIRR